jgi:hypothetical protein
MFDEVVKEVRQENIVQFVSDKKALQQRYDIFFSLFVLPITLI